MDDIAAGVVIILAGLATVAGGIFVVKKGFKEVDRQQENALVDQAEEVMENFILILTESSRKDLKAIAAALHVLRSTDDRANRLSSDYAQSACMKKKNKIALVFSRRRGEGKRTYSGLLLASFRESTRDRKVLVVEIDVVLGHKGGGPQVVMPLKDMNFTVLRQTFEQYKRVRFQLYAIDDEHVINFYEECGFQQADNAVNGLVLMVFEQLLK